MMTVLIEAVVVNVVDALVIVDGDKNGIVVVQVEVVVGLVETLPIMYGGLNEEVHGMVPSYV